MNNNRLSTNYSSYVSNSFYMPDLELNDKIENLMKSSNIVFIPSGTAGDKGQVGRYFIESKNKFISGGKGQRIEVYQEDKERKNKVFTSIRSASFYYEVSESILYTRLKSGKSFDYKGELLYVKYVIDSDQEDPYKLYITK